MDEVTRNIKSGVPQKGPFVTHDASALNDAESLTHETIVMESPLIEHREVIASLADSTTFGKLLAARASSLGFAGAPLKAFIADSSSTNWGIWQGKVQPVIAEVATRVAELGSLPPDASTTDPRQIVADTLTYLTNQQSRMNYPAYRQSGLPITSSPIESTVKQINHRVKGSEKFWSASGGEALLQLRADQLSDTNPPGPVLDQSNSRSNRPQKSQKTDNNLRLTNFKKCVVRPVLGSIGSSIQRADSCS